MNPIRVLLADDHALVRAGLRTLIETFSGVEIVAEANDGYEVLHLSEAHRPDVVLMDIAMPNLNGLDGAARLAQVLPKVRVIILSMHATEEYVLQALRVGVAGYLLKDMETVELERAIRAVARGETYLYSRVSGYVSDYVRRVGTMSDSGPLERLTLRQREVFQLIAEGHTSREIADTLHLSVKTVETHRSNLMKQLDVRDIASLTRLAVQLGLVSPEVD